MTEILTRRCVLRMLDDGRMLVAPQHRPGDWREVEVGALDNWLWRVWRERALDPAPPEPQA